MKILLLHSQKKIGQGRQGNPLVLLDTCTLLWLASEQDKLSVKAKKAIERNAVFVSAITAFEIAVKVRSGKLELPLPAMTWFSEALDFHGVKEFPLTSRIAVKAVELPLLHNDPCDRIIIATASMNGMSIITCDQRISQYTQANTVW